MRLRGSSKFVGVASVSFRFAFRFVSRFTSTPVKERQKLVSELCMAGTNRMRMASMRESRDSVRFLVNTQVQSHAKLRRGFGTSVPFI